MNKEERKNQAYEEHEKKVTPFLNEYFKKRDILNEEYDKKLKDLLTEYHKKIDPFIEEYDEKIKKIELCEVQQEDKHVHHYTITNSNIPPFREVQDD